MAKTRSQEDDPVPQWLLRYEEATEQWISRLQEANDQWISRFEARFAGFLCRSRKENPEDQICNDEELTEIEAETKSSGIEDRAVENEANSDVISAIVKEESIPQFLMVTEADSTCVQHTNVILQQVSISPLEHSLKFCKANLDVKGNCQSAMGKTHQIWSDSNFRCVNDEACQVFDVIPMRTKVLPKEHKERFHKSWRFKFKHKVAPRDSKSVFDVLRTTLGPSSMLKMHLNAGGIVVTTEGNAILRGIDVAHPAAKSMIELSRTQDEGVGVGTTSVIVLAGELSHVGESFIEKSYHPTVIFQAYNKALEGVIAVLDKAAMPIDVKDRATVLGLVKSCIGTKFISEFGDLIADLAIDATTTISVDLGQGLREVDISDLACHYFSKAGVSTIRRLRKTDNNRIAKACGAVIVNRPDELQESDVIFCPLAEHLKPGYVVFFTKEASGKLEQFSGLCKKLKDIDVSLASFYVWLRETSFVVQQVRRNKKIRLSKRWWFKYKYHCYSFCEESFANQITSFSTNLEVKVSLKGGDLIQDERREKMARVAREKEDKLLDTWEKLIG